METNRLNIKLYQFMEPKQASVERNNANKLFGSDGQTVVFWHRNIEKTADGTTRKTVRVMDSIQETLVDTLGQRVAANGVFATVSRPQGMSEEAGFVPIHNLHTTVSAQYVVDSQNEAEWKASAFKTQLRLAADILDSEERPTFDKFMQQVEADMQSGIGFDEALARVQENPIMARVIGYAKTPRFVKILEVNREAFTQAYENEVIVLKPNALKVVPNGAVLVEWDGGEKMQKLKKDVATLGGTLKYGALDNPPPNVGTTLGFIPGFHKMTRDEKSTLEAVVANESQRLSGAELHLRPKEHLHSVSFRCNDLAPVFSSWTKVWEANSVFPRQPTAIAKPGREVS